jgi:hypothetical protein
MLSLLGVDQILTVRDQVSEVRTINRRPVIAG